MLQRALKRAKDAADGKDVRLGGGVATVRQYLAAGLIDEIHIVVSLMLLESGEHLLQGIDLFKLGFECKESGASQYAAHVVIAKK